MITQTDIITNINDIHIYCDDCIGFEDYSNLVNKIVYCKKCWKIGETYRVQITEYEILLINYNNIE